MDVMPGLENVVAAETRLSDVDGAAGKLVIAGADVERLAGGFEEVAAERLTTEKDPVAGVGEG